MSDSCLSRIQKLGSDVCTAADSENSEDQNYEVLDLIREKAETARGVYRRTHAIVQETQRLVEQASARAKDAEVRANASEAALKSAEERARRAETKVVQLTEQLELAKHYQDRFALEDRTVITSNVRRTRPKLPSSAALVRHNEASVRKIWPFR